MAIVVIAIVVIILIFIFKLGWVKRFCAWLDGHEPYCKDCVYFNQKEKYCRKYEKKVGKNEYDSCWGGKKA